ncbi:MAG: primosomal protein N' [Gallionella sp.]
MNIVRVALDVPLATLFDYTVAPGVAVAIGQLVVVPFGTRRMVGVVMECAAGTEVLPGRIKQVSRVLADDLLLSAELRNLLVFCSDYYRYPIGQAVMAALPARLRAEKSVSGRPECYFRLSRLGEALDLAAFPRRKVVQRRILETLAEYSSDLSQLKGMSTGVAQQLRALIAAGLVETVEGRLPPSQLGKRSPGPESSTDQPLVAPHFLTDEQRTAVEAVNSVKSYRCFLLHGITGSGKTEVYVRLIHNVISDGGQALLLVPEINLTPQLENYFLTRFPGISLSSLHSGLSERERIRNWQHARSGNAKIVLGTRLAVFAELPDLKLIIVDEEHDSSYKQQDGLRYSARDVAIFRASQRSIPIVLGSATPSLESYYNAQTGRYQLLKLTVRAQAEARLPVVRCVDTKLGTVHHGIHERVLIEIEKRIVRNEQCLVFINRRGYAPVLMCGTCNWLSDCKNCAGKMVLHLKDEQLRCHLCGYQVRLPNACPSCGSAGLHPVGSGTQRVESALRERFAAARILRVDADSTRAKGSWGRMRDQISARQVDILVGTQMLAKGHDFPAMTLVCVINADSALYSSDFRSAEKLFAQLVQVGGRAGRADKPGEVLIQTSFPDHPMYHALQTHDFEYWAGMQLAERKMTEFPPFAFQAVLRAEGKVENEVLQYLNGAREQAVAASATMHAGDQIRIFGVVPAALPRRANYIRAQLVVQSTQRKTLQEFLGAWQSKLQQLTSKKLRCSLDVDPHDY